MTSNSRLRKMLTAKHNDNNTVSRNDWLSSGSTLLNLLCTNKYYACWYKGGYSLLVGDSDSGKTWLSMETFAQASRNSNFSSHRFIHDNAEGGALMDITKYFGTDVAKRIEEPPRGVSDYIEDFYFNLDDLYQKDEPFIYILDSMDSIDSIKDEKKFQAEKKARNKQGKEESGSYGTHKAKANSAGLRKAKKFLKATGSILIIISQTRDNIGPDAMFNRKTRAGGRAPKFYARLEIWSSVKGQIKKTVMGKPRKLGIISKLEVKKNHITGNKGSVEVPIYNSYGLDDIGSCIDWLCEESHWSNRAGKINAEEFEFSGSKEKLIQCIEDTGTERRLQKLVGRVWNEIQEACQLKRKKRYE